MAGSDTRASGTGLTSGADMSTGAAVVGVGLLINTRTTAAVLASRAVTAAAARTRPFHAGFPGSTDMPTGTAVAGVSMQVRANPIAVRLACWTADAFFTRCTSLTYIATGAAVVVISIGIDAGAIAQHLTSLAPCTDSTHTYLARQAGMAAGTAVLGAGLQVYAGATTLGQSALTDAGAIATGRVVAAVRCGCSTGLAR